MLNKKTKLVVAAAMSGGVDSSVTAALLKKQGYRVVGFFMKNWSDTFGLKHSDCPWLQDRQDAMRAAAKLDIPLETLDFEKEYKRTVLDYFFKEYRAGRTPNPDILCNEKIKFGVFLDKARGLGADFIATGHYARLAAGNPKSQIPRLPCLGIGGQANPKQIQNSKFKTSNKSQLSAPYSSLEKGDYTGSVVSCQLLKAKDKDKDQTYFLYRLNQEQLSRSIFPIGDYTKTQVRALAKKFGLANWDKPDSQGVCFMGHIDLAKFLSQKIKAKPGAIITNDGKAVGRHQGLHIYTIGQRKGIGVGGVGPFYVLAKDYKKNQLVVTANSKDKDLFSKEIIFTDANWIAGSEPKFPLRAAGRVRYREKLGSCVVSRTTPLPPSLEKEGGGRPLPPSLQRSAEPPPAPSFARRGRGGGFYRAVFKTPRWAVSSGQSLVLYKGEECLGGGIIV